MKKLLFANLTVIFLLVMTTGAALAAPEAEGTAISVLEVRQDAILFSVSGHFTQEELNGGSLQFGGEIYELHCAQVDDVTVHCTMPLKALGENLIINFGGSNFWVKAPQANFCSPVYDYELGNETSWINIGQHCDDHPAQVGDTIEFYNSFGWNEWYDYDFMDPSTLPCVDFGAGYYYNFCFSFPF